MRYLFAQCHSLLPPTHQVFDLLEVVLCAIVLELLHHLHIGSAVILPDVLDEVRSVTDWLTLKCEDEGTVSLIEAIRSANLKARQEVTVNYYLSISRIGC